MGRKNLFFVIAISCLVLTACGTKEEVQQVAVLASFVQNESVEHSIDSLYAHEEPLITRENVYVDNELVYYTTYEYDNKNRYSMVCRYQKNVETYELELSTKEKYTYDDYFCYREKVYVQKNGLITKDIYDLHGNVIYTQVPINGNTDVRTMTCSYRYPIDTPTVQEEYCYVGEGMGFSHYMLQQFNEFGEEIYRVRQYDDGISTRETEYTYDSEGRILTQKITDNIDNIGYKNSNIINISYSYNKEGKVSEKVQESTEYNGSLVEMSTIEKINYQYDEQGRLVSEERRHTIDLEERERELAMIIVYEYEKDLTQQPDIWL